ncbi:alpha/beta hydrolase [Pseudonocardia kujensis]|uniref:alpha/beta fold hydrolase n=1 Tax=Pseudonocardia kujensis TaxID=1128675 RepID=UPI001E4A54F0|nr:alpha/beta hydrolase [Pseudonocardia kujensis]MCE0763292.1 alpha/beta hydrolase [Pseudonocardia kujensis]
MATQHPATRTVAGPAGPLSVTVTGEPAVEGTVVLVHPINSAALVWEYVSAALDRPTVALDLRGHGASTTDGPFTVEEGYVPDVLAVLDALGLQRVHLAGGSLGGSISLALAALHPDRVLSVATFGSTLGVDAPADAIMAMVTELEAKGTARYFADLVPDIVGARHRDEPRVVDGMRSAVGHRSGPLVGAILHGAFTADIRHLTARVQVPVLAATGTEDPTCPPAMTEEIAAATRTEPVFLDGLGHLPMLEDPVRVAELITAHVALAEAGTGAVR